MALFEKAWPPPPWRGVGAFDPCIKVTLRFWNPDPVWDKTNLKYLPCVGQFSIFGCRSEGAWSDRARQYSNCHKFIDIGPFVQLSCKMQRIVVAQRSNEQGIVVNFVGTRMQCASLLCSTFRIEWRNRSEYFLVFNAPNFTECFTSFIFS